MISSAFVILVNSDNRIILQHRTADAPTNPSRWQLWGGAIEKGESPEEAVIRELQEELALQVSHESLKRLENYKPNENNESGLYIIHLTDAHTKFLLGEGDGYGFFDKGAASSLDLEEMTRSCIETYSKEIFGS